MEIKWKNCFRVGVSVFLMYLCIYYWSQAVGLVGAVIGAASPLIIGFVVAYVVNILMSFYEKRYFPKRTEKKFVKSRRPVCMLAAFLTVIIIVFLIIGLVLPEFIACIRLLLAKLPKAIEDFIVWLESLNIVSEDIQFETFDLSNLQENCIDYRCWNGYGNGCWNDCVSFFRNCHSIIELYFCNLFIVR